MSDQAYKNTDRELWREGGGDGNGMSYYEPSIHVTEQGGIGINVGGYVIVKTLRAWHALAAAELPKPGPIPERKVGKVYRWNSFRSKLNHQGVVLYVLGVLQGRRRP